MDAKKRILSMILISSLVLSLAACGAAASEEETATPSDGGGAVEEEPAYEGERSIVLSDSGVTLDGEEVTAGSGAVTVGNDIVYYEDGRDESYGEGSAEDEHSAEEAASHTVVSICEPGTYRISGTLSQGQIAIDLGEDAEDDPDAVVTLILDNADVTCTVAPALIFYNVYECADTENPSYDVDTSSAGANVVIADGSENSFTGSYVARIYEEGTTDKLHKYDGAFYSKMTMNVSGEAEGTGVLNISGDNEGLDTEMHLTINGGVINIEAANDGINTNEDNVSVTTINGGTLTIDAGLGAEGDGIDSNGWLVINGGTVFASACAEGGDSGIDATLEIIINGGTVMALGNMFDTVSADSAQEYLTLTLTQSVEAGSAVELTDSNGNALFSFTAPKAASMLLLSSPEIVSDAQYTLTVDGEEREYSSDGGMMGGPGGAPGGMRGGFMEIPEGLESYLETAEDMPDEIRSWLEGLLEQQNTFRDMEPPEGMDVQQDRPEALPDGVRETPPDSGEAALADSSAE